MCKTLYVENEIMEMLYMPICDEPSHSIPSNIQIAAVEYQREQTVSTIQNLSQVDVSSFI